MFDLNGDGIVSGNELQLIIEGRPPTAPPALGELLLGGIPGLLRSPSTLIPGAVQKCALRNTAANAADDLAIRFGNNANQVFHAFRYTDALGLDRALVQSEVMNHIKSGASQIVPGKPYNQIIQVGDQLIQYTAYRLPGGIINVGRIHRAP